MHSSLELAPHLPDPTSLPILTFKARVNNPHSYLSNFYPFVSNFEAITTPKPDSFSHLFVHPVDGAFLTVEHMYQWNKMSVLDPAYADERIRHAPTALLAKRYASKKAWVDHTYVKPGPTKKRLGELFDSKVKIFRQQCMLTTMRCALRLKFEQNAELRAALVGTGAHPLGELGRSRRDFWAKTGENMLGRLLMELRDELVS